MGRLVTFSIERRVHAPRLTGESRSGSLRRAIQLRIIDLSTVQLQSMLPMRYVNNYNVGVTPIPESLGACRVNLESQAVHRQQKLC